MVTLPLEKMATRVAGSLCLATGLGEQMIVSRYTLNYFYIAHRHHVLGGEIYIKHFTIEVECFKSLVGMP